MTRKHFQAIAERIAQWSPPVALTDSQINALRADFALQLCGALWQANPRFDRQRFLTACGVAS